jgi:hypothetical protein
MGVFGSGELLCTYKYCERRSLLSGGHGWSFGWTTANAERLIGSHRPLDFGLLTYLRMTLGAFVTGADLHQAMRLRRELTRAVNLKLKTYDALITASAVARRLLSPISIRTARRTGRSRPCRSTSPATGDVDPDRLLRLRPAAVDAGRRPRLR